MKQLKFRIYEKSLNRFLGDNDHFLLSDTGQLWWINKQGKCYTLDLDNYVVQLFTGLLDAGEHEIYEGDVIKITTIEQNMSIIREVFYGNGGFAYNLTAGGKNIPVYLSHYFGTPRQSEKIKVEIIGNIFENPELL